MPSRKLPNLDTPDTMDACANCGCFKPVTDYQSDGWYVWCPNHAACLCQVGPFSTEIEARTAWNAKQRRNRET